MARLGIEAFPDDFLTSADATIRYLRGRYLPETVYYVCGTESLKNQLRLAGLRVAETLRDDCSVVLLGYDTELTYEKLENCCILLNRGADYVATHPDLVCPTEYGYVPDCGSVCAMITNATGKKPYYIGKPRPEMPLFAIERINKLDSRVCAENTLVVGDRIYTDIASGVNAGTKTLLVLSGETTLGQAKAHEIKSDAIFDDCGVILDILKGGEAK